MTSTSHGGHGVRQRASRERIPCETDPGAHGGDPGDAFTVVAPSLPGFGFSGPVPAGGLTADAVAGLWCRLMGEGLGYRRYVAHGSDLGAGVTARLARAHPGAVAGIHLATPGLAARGVGRHLDHARPGYAIAARVPAETLPLPRSPGRKATAAR
jgi:pimeloyl-ACP methyl ester carboxylesterase